MSLQTITVAADGGGARAMTSNQLAKDSMSTSHLVFTVLAALAPLTLIVSVSPLLFLMGGAAVPGGFLVAGCIMILFAVGFAAITRYMRNAGAFYVVISRGLGRHAGAGAAMLALVAYNAVQIGTYGSFGVYAASMADRLAGVQLPWWCYSILALIGVGLLGYRGIDTSARVLMAVLTAEIAVLLWLCVSILSQSGLDMPFAALNPVAALRPSNSAMLALVFGAFMGFESTAIYSEEAKGGAKTVRRATFIAVSFIAVLFCAISFVIVTAYGAANIQTAATADPINLIVALFERYTNPVILETMNVLLLASLFAALLALHNICNRYFFTLGRARLLPKSLSLTSASTHAPWVAGSVQSALAIVCLAAVVLLNIDPYLGLLLWGGALGVLGIITLWATCSLAIVIFLRRQQPGKRLFESLIAPAISAICLYAILIAVLFNMPVFTESNGPINELLIGLGVLSILVGVFAAYRLRTREPANFVKLGEDPVIHS